ncbi:endo-1,4-beta-xylanase [Actinokineospora guangxiensis]|uniref:Beta-xylanase n=1 Tax=Actinokineospora guangxiensis TaxID=1490288 RepID=A0ABW0EUU8_9PSEU
MKPLRIATAVLVAAAMATPLVSSASATPQHQPPGQSKKDALRAEVPKGFFIGTAVAGGGHHEDQPYPDPFSSDQPYRNVLAKEFNSVSAENQMKWDFLRPEPGVYRFGPADDIVAFAKRNNQVVRGHTLLWHSQNPAWLTEGGYTKAQLKQILRDHIRTVVGRYKGKIQQWDVANEIFDDQGVLRSQDNIWIRELGPGIVADAFRWARQADPKAKLYFNDYNVEGINAKSNAYYALIQDLLAQGVPVDGFSTQGHLSLRYGFPGDLTDNLRRFARLGLETAITEVDVRMDLAPGATPTPEQLAKQAEYYQRMLDGCLSVSSCNSFTIWGFVDKYSWVPVFFPSEGAATIMWDDFSRKPAYHALRDSLKDCYCGRK